MNKVEAMFKAVQDVDTGRYGLGTEEMKELYKRYSRDPFWLIHYAFKYGFVKGQRAEKATAKKNVAV